MPTLTEPNIGGPPPVFPDIPTGGSGGGDDKGRPGRGNSRSAAITGIVVLMCASVMTFAALVSAMVVRRGMNNDWHKLPLPQILWWNTGILILSSIALDVARRLLRRNKRQLFNRLWLAGTAMGTYFLIGQTIAWAQLADRGFFLQGNPSSAFFYVLTWAHAAHVIGALFGLYYVAFHALRFDLGAGRRNWVDVSAIFWHFLDLLWLGIMALFAFWA